MYALLLFSNLGDGAKIYFTCYIVNANSSCPCTVSVQQSQKSFMTDNIKYFPPLFGKKHKYYVGEVVEFQYKVLYKNKNSEF